MTSSLTRSSYNPLIFILRLTLKITFPGYFTNTCCSHPLNKADELETEEHIGVFVFFLLIQKVFAELPSESLIMNLASSPSRFLPSSLLLAQIPLDKFQFMTRIHYLAPSDGIWGEHEGLSLFFSPDVHVLSSCKTFHSHTFLRVFIVRPNPQLTISTFSRPMWMWL